jgi:hypothetical protein
MHQDGSLPRARRDGLLEGAVGEELLLYDQESHTAHCLSPIAASVWRHCDGEHDLIGLAQLVEVSEHLVADALRELRVKDLLAVEPALIDGIPGESRREAIVRAARYGAAAAAGSMIVSATAATPAMASSEEEGCCECQESNHKGCRCFRATPAGCAAECKNLGLPSNAWYASQTCNAAGTECVV